MPDYAKLTLQDAKKLIPDAAAAWLKANRAYRDGDHWQRGGGWVGPQPDRKDVVTWGNIRKVFVSRQVIGELVSRHVDAVLGDRPQWTVQVARPLEDDEEPTAEEQTLIDEAKAILEAFWDRRGAVTQEHDELVTPYDAMTNALKNALYFRRGVVRLYIPARFLDGDGRIPPREAAKALDVVFMQALEPTEATVALDRATMDQVGVYIYKVDGQDRAELVYLGEGEEASGEDRPTVFRVIGKMENGQTNEEMAALDLDGQLTMYEVNVPLLVTEQVRSLQAQLNMTLTMMGRNTVQAGFLERLILNGQMPFRTEIDKQTGQLVRVDEEFKVGAGTVNFISGLEYTDSDGTKHLANPSAIYRDPVSPETFARAEALLYMALLAEAKQTHALINGDAAASGESRIQARADFYNSLLPSAREIETALTWLLGTTLKLAAVISGQPDRYATLTVSTQARINTGPLSSDERRVLVEMVEKSILSHKTALGMLGIPDVEAELGQIAQEQEDKSQRQSTSLAAGLLEARARVQAGQASNGLETGQPTEQPPAQESPTNGADAAPENIESTQGLNGAQIRAALDILDGVKAGNVAPEVAVELLIALGIDRVRAERMVAQTAQSARPGRTKQVGESAQADASA